jgi:uncharacterized membrane protein YcjF (UPF0283 family)
MYNVKVSTIKNAFLRRAVIVVTFVPVALIQIAFVAVAYVQQTWRELVRLYGTAKAQW